MGHKASITEAKKKAGEESQVSVRTDVSILPGLSYVKYGIWWNIQKHKEVGNHAENKPQHNNRVPAMLHCPVANECKYNSAKNFTHADNDST